MNANETGPRARMVIEAIDALRARKARPDQERIVHWVHRRYGFTKEAVCKTIENSVREGTVIRVKYKDSISYRNPAKLTRGSGCFNPIAPNEISESVAQKSNVHGQGAVNLVIPKSDGASTSAPGQRIVPVPPMTAIKRVLRVIRQIMLSRQSTSDSSSAPVGNGNCGKNDCSSVATEQTSKGASTTTAIASSGPLVGASIQDILITLENQKQFGYDQELLQKLLERATLQGVVKAFPNGNYVLAGASRGKNSAEKASPNKMKGHRRAPGSSLMVGSGQPQLPSLVKMTATSSAVGSKRRLSDMSGTSSTKGKKGRKPATVTSANQPQRARPVSQRKKFKKTLGPDFLEPSELGMPYLQNTFDPLCDHCHKPSKEDLLYCKDCEYKAHPTCLGYSKELTQRCRQAPWQCMYCKTCCVCEGLSDLMDKKSDLMLLCDMCDQGYHMDCHDPPITSKPSGSWACSNCFRSKNSKSSGVRNRKSNREHDSDHGFEENDGGSVISYDSCENSSISEEVIAPRGKDNLDKIFMKLRPSMEEIVEAVPELKKAPKYWATDDVERFIKAVGYPEHSNLFKEQEVDGVSLLLLKRSDVVTGMTMKMGPSLKIFGHIQRLQTISIRDDNEQATSELNVGKNEESDDVNYQVESACSMETNTETVHETQMLSNGGVITSDKNEKNECGWTSRQTMNGTDFNPTIKEMNDSPGYFQYMKPDVSMDSDEPKMIPSNEWFPRCETHDFENENSIFIEPDMFTITPLYCGNVNSGYHRLCMSHLRGRVTRRIRKEIDDEEVMKNVNRRHGYYHIPYMNVIFAVAIVGLQLMSTVSCYSSSDPCRFPSEWVGRWFQKGIPEAISITSHEMSEKGVCRETSGDKFLIESRSERCVRCIVLNQKHSNVLQYKETFCFPNPRNNPRRLRDVCSEINGDASLYSLFRLDTPTVPCPFSGPFTFSYSRGHGECQEPMSSIQSCVDSTRLRFRFQACADVLGSESRDEVLSCYGEWKEGSTRYLVGKMTHKITRTDEDRFRCFVFERLSQGTSDDDEAINDAPNEGYLLAQSGDATCDGLSTVYEGSRIMKLTKSSSVIGSCDFPPEVTMSKYWKYLDEIYDFSKNSTLRVYNSTSAEIIRTITCIRQDKTANPSDEDSLETSSFFEYVVHSVSECDIGFMCLRIHKRENQVVEIEESVLNRGGDPFAEGGCSYQRFHKNYLTLFLIRQSSSTSSVTSSSTNDNVDSNNINDRDNPSSSSLDPALHSNPSVSSASILHSPIFTTVKYLPLSIILVVRQRMMAMIFR